MLKGLSQGRYEELVAKQEKDIQAPIQQVKETPQPIAVKTAPVIRAVGKTNVSAPTMAGSSDMAWLIDRTGKTRPIWISKNEALRQAKKYPKEFEVR